VKWLLADEKAESKVPSTEPDKHLKDGETELQVTKSDNDQTATKQQQPANCHRPQGLFSVDV